jgi:DNA excision repair protein ERCC-2
MPNDVSLSPRRSPRVSVPIKPFCAFVAKTGDLDLRFTPVPTAEQGMAGHKAVVYSRHSAYVAEVMIEGVVDGLHLRGRIDGLDAEAATLDEIKTHRGAVERIPANHTALHWAQLRTYGALYGRAEGLVELTLRLCYYDIDERRETQLTVVESVEVLEAELRVRVKQYKHWMAQQRAHVQRRDTMLDGLMFPHANIAEGQAQLMQAVTTCLDEGDSLMAQAPTGVGKTIGVLFPALKALGQGQVDKLFYLTAKNAVQGEVDKALRSLATEGKPLPLRVLLLSAKERACVYPDRACHGESCPRAKGFYDRLPAARDAAQHMSRQDLEALKALAQTHQVCPYFLGQEMARWADLVIGDVNYYFDGSAILYALTEQQGWRVAVLVDEAHNLVDRARAMYSASLSQDTLRSVARGVAGSLKSALAGIDRALIAMRDFCVQNEVMPSEPPRVLRDALTQAIRQIGRWFADDAGRHDAPLLNLYFDLIGLQRLAERYDTHSLCEVTEGEGASQDLLHEATITFTLHNVVPAPHLLHRLRAAHAVIVFSATLSPPVYHQKMLGLVDDSDFCDVRSGFAAHQLQVRLVSHIATEYRVRHLAARPIATLIADAYAEAPGNYIAYFSSFAYLDQVAAAFIRLAPEIATVKQSAQMSLDDRHAFLRSFTATSRQIGFAVLGGSFSEGVDLPGKRLVGAFVCNLGLTPFTALNARMAAQVDEAFGYGSGQRYIYLYPAIQKVVQAVGRVVRTTSDRGTVYLIDRRFGDAHIQQLLPPSWQMTRWPASG